MVELRSRRVDGGYNKIIDLNKKSNPPQQKLLPLKSLIDPHRRKELIKKLFKNNESEFEELVHELEPIQEWQEALQKVEQELKHRNIHLQERKAVLFTNILYHRYFPEDDQIKI